MSTPSRLLTTAGIGAMLLALPVAAMLQSQREAPVSVPQEAAPSVPAEVIVSRWERLLSPQAAPSLGEITDFLRHHPGFPNDVEIRQRAEREITVTTPVESRLAFFAVSEPLSATGRFRWADALMQAGRTDEATEQARIAWRSGGVTDDARPAFLTRFANVMRAEDHAQRADMMLWDGDLDGAAAMFSLLGPEDRTLTSIRIALQRGTKRGGDIAAARAAIQSAPDAVQRHPGYIRDLYSFYRNNSASAQARRLLAGATIAPGSAGHKNAWMLAHLEAARAAAADRQYQLAYDIAAHHGGLSFSQPLLENSAAERDTFTSIEWLAGWTALHDLGKPADAVRHFQNFSNAAKFASTRARGLYWAGRAAEAAGRADATAFYEQAARYNLVFYGQLAHERLGRELVIATGDTPTPGPDIIAGWNADPRVKAVEIYGTRGDTGKQRMFMAALADGLTRAQFPLYAQLADRWGHERFAVLNMRGADTTKPDAVIDLSWRQMTLPAEARHMWTMVHALTRQESQFELDAVSPAGARGLMQLMRPTARETAGKIGLPYRPDALTRDRGYNIRLGSTYFANMLDNWGGSHVLAIASYNAGPGNVRRWVRENGDPRTPQVDVLEWIEEIPFHETKTYVRNVMENAVIYDTIAPENRKGGPQQARLSWYLGKNDRG
ncbi:lytic transglycosylase domain-containing protein [Pacificimonas sp. WHA3]|uniref:Lytic transglycosylase domain-containing protein n=1 Tax=Pacificimonas pallii TaxID=2827236 RepID=A0ABS6SF53_9SPHN|nr:lytic transglycosylase domain-containing protein [Pacificimonas pallii]MBV7257029.1 lytic transglycosylase domain-containing protein [Pacificimonas pallii]